MRATDNRGVNLVVDPVVVPRLNELLARRGAGGGEETGDGAAVYFARNPNAKFKTMAEVRNSPDYAKVMRRPSSNTRAESGMSEAAARDELMIAVMKVMADNRLDAIVHKAVEHTPTLIKDGINPPYVNQKGAPHLNTFLIYAPRGRAGRLHGAGSAGGITFFGRPYSEPTIIKYAYAYAQATRHRRLPYDTAAGDNRTIH